MSGLNIAIEGDKQSFRPGEALRGTVSWTLDDDSKKVELRLMWYTAGKGMPEVGVIESVNFENPLKEDRREFEFKLPESPYSFSGKLITLTWGMELIVRPFKQTQRMEFTMSPTGQVIRLGNGQLKT